MSLNFTIEVGKRLRLERKRLGFKTQASMAQALGIPERTYWDRETGKVAPDAEFFAAFREIGGDLMFVLTGNRSHVGVSDGWKPYTPSERAAAAIQDMKLTEEDGQMLIDLAKRLARP